MNADADADTHTHTHTHTLTTGTTRRKLLAVSSAAAIPGLGGCASTENTGGPTGNDDPADEEPNEPAVSDTGPDAVADPEPRLIVGDASTADVGILEVSSGELLDSIPIEDADPILGIPKYGQVAAVSQPEAGTTHLIDSGTWATEHGADAEYHVTAPSPVAELDLERPLHTSAGHGYLSIFADGSGTAHFVHEARTLEADAPDVTAIETPAPHHGGATALGPDLFAVSWVQEQADFGVADEVAVFYDDERVDTYDCPGLHGEIAVEGGGLFAGADHVLALEAHGDYTEATTVEYPDEIDRVGYFEGVSDHTRVAAADSGHLVLFDAASNEFTVVTELPAETAGGDHDTGVHVTDDGAVIVLTPEGRLHQFDLESGERIASSDPRETVAFESGDDEPVPAMAGGREAVYVTSPVDGDVHEFTTDGDLRHVRTMPVGDTPSRLGFFGAYW